MHLASQPLFATQHETDDVSVSFKGYEIIHHAPGRPAIEIGTGNADYRPNKKQQAYFNPVDRDLVMTNVKRCAITENLPGKVIINVGDTVILDLVVIDDRLHISIDVKNGGEGTPDFNRFTIYLPAEAGEHVYGFGEQYTVLDMRGRKVPLWTQEPGLARDHSFPALVANALMGAGGKWHTTYFPQPTFISSNGYFVHAESHTYAEFDFTSKTCHRLHFWGIPKKFVVDVQPSAADTLRSLTGYLGRQRPLPDWAIEGMWLGIGGGMDEARDGAASVPWKVRYIKDLHGQGIRFLGYNNCFLMHHGPMYKEAAEKGYLIKTKDGAPYALKMLSFSAGMLDLTNPGCRDWIKGIIKEHMIGIGLDGWMCDFGEYLPVDCVLHSGEDPALVHNEYPVLWAKVNDEAVKEAGRETGTDAIVFFSRSGNAGSSRHTPLVWAGDQQVTFQVGNGLASVIPAGISLGLSGIGHHHSDIGGYFSFLHITRGKEAFMRWTEQAAFTVVMRTHQGKDFKAEKNWTFYSDGETLAHFARFSKIHASMLPYTRHVLDEYQAQGLPAMRHPWLHYEADPAVHSLKYEYLFGRDLLVAPVYRKGRASWKVYLPRDTWVHLWSQAEHAGGWVKVDAPVGQPPVFYRKQSPFSGLFAGLRDVA